MTTKRVYFIALGLVLLASIYPIYMGILVVVAYLQNGGINAADYPKYIIPYTPICIALIVSTLLIPLAVKYLKKFSTLAISVVATVWFFASELAFERIAVFEKVTEWQATELDIGSWQMYSCVAAPSAPQYVYEQIENTISNPLGLQYDPAFKIHFYIIALLIILSVLRLICGFVSMARSHNYAKKTPLLMQLVAVILFIGLCILACFTAFYRTGTLTVSPLSATLMIAFFAIFGLNFGIYLGAITYRKRSLYSLWLPVIVAMVATTVMYVGELILLSGRLYQLGEGAFFEPLATLPFAPADFATIALSGVITFLLLGKCRLIACMPDREDFCP
jgi:hypothetical protein